MESIGWKLKNARESSDVTVEQAARDTHISKRYLHAIEAEDFDQFPGETYLLGFLRTYAEYLGLDPKEVATLYKNLKLQEQPAPLDELIVKRNRGPAALVIIAILVVVGLGVGIYFLAANGFFARLVANAGDEEEPEETIVQEYEFTGTSLETSFRPGEAVRVPTGDSTVLLVFRQIDDDVTLETPVERFAMAPQDERLVDLTGDGNPDLRIAVGTVSGGRAVVQLDRSIAEIDEPAETVETATFEGLGSPGVADRERRSILIRPDFDNAEFATRIVVTRPTFVRARADEGDWIEGFYGEDASVEVSANVRLDLSFADPGAVDVTVAGERVEVGRPGSPASWVVGRRTDEDGDPDLVLYPAY